MICCWMHSLFVRVEALLSFPAQCSLLVKVVPEHRMPHFSCFGHAKRLANICFCLRRPALDALQRSGVAAAFLSATAFAMAAAARCLAASRLRGVSARRFAVGSDLCAYCWAEAGQQNPDPAVRRGLSLVAGHGTFSRSFDSAPVLAATFAAHDSATGALARSVAAKVAA